MRIFKPFFTKISIVLSVFLFATLMFSCEQKQEYKESVTEDDIKSMVSDHIIPLGDAVKMYKKYDKDRTKILKDTLEKKYKDPKFKDTRMVWVDIKDMRAYLKYLEDNTEEAEGLAFYFGVNSDKDNGKKKNHQTFFVAPTIKNVIDGDTIQSGYTVENGKKIFLYKEYKSKVDANGNVQKASFFNLTLQDPGYLFNDQTPNPPGGNN